MSDQQNLRSACAYAQSDQNLCFSLEYSLTVKLLTEHHLEFLTLKGGYTGLSLHLSKCHIVGNHMSRLNYKAYEMCKCMQKRDWMTSDERKMLLIVAEPLLHCNLKTF